jgi:hypothetical protein
LKKKGWLVEDCYYSSHFDRYAVTAVKEGCEATAVVPDFGHLKVTIKVLVTRPDERHLDDLRVYVQYDGAVVKNLWATRKGDSLILNGPQHRRYESLANEVAYAVREALR